MREHIANKIYHVELMTPKQSTDTLEADMEKFAEKYAQIMDAGYCACITDNPMGHLSFQGTEMIRELSLPVNPGQVMLHLNAFHTKEVLDQILKDASELGIKYILAVSGDGSERLPRVAPADIGYDVKSVTSVELIKYINREYPGKFALGVAYNAYEPQDHEEEKLQRKLAAGASFIITQPIIESHPSMDILRSTKLPVVVEAWMSKKLHLLSECVGYKIPEDTAYDPIACLKKLHANYPDCGVYLALIGMKTQFPLLKSIW